MANVKPTGREPIYVTDPMSEKLLAYQDSLSKYNEYKRAEPKFYEYAKKNNLRISNQPVVKGENDYLPWGNDPLSVKSYNVGGASSTISNSFYTQGYLTKDNSKEYGVLNFSKTNQKEIKNIGNKTDRLTGGYNLPKLEKYKKPVQPVKLISEEKLKKLKTKETEKPKETSKAQETKKAEPKADKQFYQGRQFMEATGLRPDYYTKEEVERAKARQDSVYRARVKK
jgi:hypothetical protein